MKHLSYFEQIIRMPNSTMFSGNGEIEFQTDESRVHNVSPEIEVRKELNTNNER